MASSTGAAALGLESRGRTCLEQQAWRKLRHGAFGWTAGACGSSSHEPRCVHGVQRGVTAKKQAVIGARAGVQ